MIEYKKLLLAAQEILKSKKKKLVFHDLWKQVCLKNKINQQEADDMAADFYQYLLESNLFFFDAKTREWGLRENIKFETYQKISDTFLSNASDDIKEKDYKNDMSLIEINELERGNRNDMTSILGFDDDDKDDIDDESDSIDDLDDVELDIEE